MEDGTAHIEALVGRHMADLVGRTLIQPNEIIYKDIHICQEFVVGEEE